MNDLMYRFQLDMRMDDVFDEAHEWARVENVPFSVLLALLQFPDLADVGGIVASTEEEPDVSKGSSAA